MPRPRARSFLTSSSASRRRSNSKPPHIAAASKVVDALAADCLLFDDSPEGERLRRFELACGRGIWRSLDSLRKIRQATKDPLSVVHCPSPVADSTTEALDEPESTNEPTDGPLSGVRCPLQAASCAADAVVETGTTNEPTVARRKRYKRTHRWSACQSSVVRCRLPVAAADAAVELKTTNEPTDACENETNEPTEGPLPFPVAMPRQLRRQTRRTNPSAVSRGWGTVPRGGVPHATNEPIPPGKTKPRFDRSECREIESGYGKRANELSRQTFGNETVSAASEIVRKRKSQ